MAIVSLGVLVAFENSRQRAQREKEADLLFVGDQFRDAIDRFHALAPAGSGAQFPQSLDDLVEDKRFPNKVRHLRRIYADPLTGSVDWVLDKQQGQIIGVHSPSTLTPIRHAGFVGADAQFAKAKSYSEWQFLASSVQAMPTEESAASPTPSVSNVSEPSDTGNTPTPTFGNPAVAACMTQFSFPAVDCRRDSPPMGTDTASCQRAFAALYKECMANIQ